MEWYQILLLAVGIAALFLAVVLVGVAGVLYRIAILRRKEKPRTEGELPFEQMMRKKKKDYYLPSVQAGVDYMKEHRREAEEVYIDAEDGLKLHAALFTVDRPVGLIAFFHGYRSSGEADFAPWMPRLKVRGFDVLLVDHRAHGLSDGKHICFGVKERRDLRAWLRYAAKRFPDLPLFVWGVSMGGATVLFGVEQEGLPPALAGAVADCGYDVPYEEVAWFAHKIYGVPFARLFVALADPFCRLFAHFTLYEDCGAAKHARNAACPVMILHGTSDDVVPFENGERIYAALHGKKAFFVGKNALHGCSFLEEPERCGREVAAFLDECLALKAQNASEDRHTASGA